jgi:hypothetical protein
MAGELKTLYQNITKWVQAWDYTSLGTVMDPQIIAKKVLHPDYVAGKNTLMAYLQYDMFASKPIFTPDDTKIKYHPKAAADQDSATYAHVRGIGTYQDSGADTPVSVAFVWSFSRATKNDTWLLVNVFGAPIEGDNNF